MERGKIAGLEPRADFASLMATTAIVHDLVLLTCNATDYANAGADVFSPWSDATKQ
jgi:predicted nucleic acid-binding protein